MRLIEELAKTPVANKRFKAYYDNSSWALNVAFKDFLQLDFRYQHGVFIDYLTKENFGISVLYDGYITFIIDESKLDPATRKADFLFEVTASGVLTLESKTTPFIDSDTYDIRYQNSFKYAILSCFKAIHNTGTGYNTEFDKKINTIINKPTI
jgi:hypothetical protein